MNTEDHALAQRLSDVQIQGEGDQFRPSPAFGHGRNLTGDSDYFSMSSLSSSSSDSSLSFQWKQDPILASHQGEDSGYALSGSTSTHHSNHANDPSSPYAPIAHVRSRDRPSLRLQDDATNQSFNNVSDRGRLARSPPDSECPRAGAYNNIAPYPSTPDLQGNLTPRIGAFWQSESKAFPQSLYEVQHDPKASNQDIASLSNTGTGHMPTLSSDELYYNQNQVPERILRYSHSVSTSRRLSCVDRTVELVALQSAPFYGEPRLSSTAPPR